MPEGDTVWRTAHHLHEVLAGRDLVTFDLRVPDFATSDLTGHRVDEVVSRGKHLLTRIGSFTLHTHLKMEGAWHVQPRGAGWRRPAHSARAVLETTEHQAIGYSLGVVELVPRDAEDTVVGHLGPDLLGPDWDAAEAVRRLRTDPTRPVFLALLDQRNLAGLGNEYVNELLFTAGLAPTRPVSDVPDLPRLVARGRQMLDVNKARVERSFTGSTRPGQERWVYSRERRPCRRCGTRISQGSLGDDPVRQRNTFWCPHCQT
ncbi:putative DNA-formamidopyrimidine glycosylase [Aeromicrobium marinum DSM 15272]|uniref:DNA-(apurinic or apyrimidinic site) lyase n=1 Tax=Aeromicrobium marinum DSM 15272 TaxID=585531 RepID=E2SDR1_9ACTN|nr:DNA-formamidopyrimidine glycosylase family protein [Aeromicrobium marinum]EFQ82638.1 putative DNA-formamidopyrimidine glycosylase [Aeromicrobium marinum DSM 15272]